MSTNKILILIGLVNLLYVGMSEGICCVQQLSSCACQSDYYNITFNFSRLDAGGGTQAEFRYIASTTTPPQEYLFNPCSGIYCQGDTDTAICLEKSALQAESLGDQATAEFQSVADID